MRRTACFPTRRARRGESEAARRKTFSTTTKAMKTNFLNPLLIAGLLAVNLSNARAETETELIATLQSNASIIQKCDACQKLRLMGTAKAVPALAALLNQ